MTSDVVSRFPNKKRRGVVAFASPSIFLDASLMRLDNLNGKSL